MKKYYFLFFCIAFAVSVCKLHAMDSHDLDRENTGFFEEAVNSDIYLLEQITRDEQKTLVSLFDFNRSDQIVDTQEQDSQEAFERKVCDCKKEIHRLQHSVDRINQKWHSNFEVPSFYFETELERCGRQLFGNRLFELLGLSRENIPIGPYGKHEINDKVRVSYINGILNTRALMLEALCLISNSHGDVIVHNIFRPTLGWTKDVLEAIVIKTSYMVAGHISKYAVELVRLWRSLIQDMGGVDGGGVIIHYAHSLGGTDTDRARDLLSEKEQKMIRVVTFGSPTLIKKGGFQKVVNICSSCDGIPAFDVLGHIRNYSDEDSNIYVKTAKKAPVWPCDHVLSGSSYGLVLEEMGKAFQEEFNNR